MTPQTTTPQAPHATDAPPFPHRSAAAPTPLEAAERQYAEPTQGQPCWEPEDGDFS